MPSQSEVARQFHSLHKKGDPVILFNIWDAGSAQTVAGAGASALATGSAPVAMAMGFADGEDTPLELMLDNLSRITAIVDIPVTADIEGGYGVEPAEVADTLSRTIEAGAVGCNFEDQIVGTGNLYDIADQVLRISAARETAGVAGVNVYINARTDIFLKAKPETHNGQMLEAALERARAYEQAGASGFFAPGLVDETLIAGLCETTNLPVNIMFMPGVPDSKTLAALGVSRISYGGFPYLWMSKWLKEEARQALDG